MWFGVVMEKQECVPNERSIEQHIPEGCYPKFSAFKTPLFRMDNSVRASKLMSTITITEQPAKRILEEMSQVPNALLEAS